MNDSNNGSPSQEQPASICLFVSAQSSSRNRLQFGLDDNKWNSSAENVYFSSTDAEDQYLVVKVRDVIFSQ